MADKSKIEWTDATWNPIRGCSVVSEGCRNCYAMAVAARFSDKGLAYEGLAYRNGSGAHWAGQVKLIEKHLEDPLRWKRPRRIFVNSMSDLFHESIPDGWIVDIFRIMETARKHQFQVLTKRPQRMLDFVAHRSENNPHRCPASNVWLGVSCEDQKTADERIPLLLQTPAVVRWVSAEPLLGPVSLDKWLPVMTACQTKNPSPETIKALREMLHAAARMTWPTIDWVVVGGESGPGARPMHPDWAHSLRDQCVAAGVQFFFKQWGEWDGGGVFSSGCDDPCGRCVMALRSWDGTRWSGSDLTGTDWVPSGGHTGALQIHRIGKKAAGRLLDGREWNEYPDVALGGA